MIVEARHCRKLQGRENVKSKQNTRLTSRLSFFVRCSAAKRNEQASEAMGNGVGEDLEQGSQR